MTGKILDKEKVSLPSPGLQVLFVVLKIFQKFTTVVLGYFCKCNNFKGSLFLSIRVFCCLAEQKQVLWIVK